MKWRIRGSQKLALFLQKEAMQDCSGKKIRRLLEDNICRVNGVVERFGSRQLEKGDLVELDSSWKQALRTSSASFLTLYEDEHLLLVDKPSGWICDPLHVQKTFGQNLFLVHRLDKDTTGVLALAKTPVIRDELTALFKERSVHKQYLALVAGLFEKKEGTRQSYLVKKKSFQGQTIWGSSQHGLFSETKWHVEAEGKKASLVFCEPTTGRTHQIRVHLAEMGHPILVDRQYGPNLLSLPCLIQRTMLHAYSLDFELRHKKIHGVSCLPLDMQDVLRKLGFQEKIVQKWSQKVHGPC